MLAPESKTWRVWARITGPYLPHSDIRIGNASVGPGPKGYRPSGPPTPPTLTPSEDLTYFTATSPRLHIVSDCWIVVEDVRAASADAAIRKVEEQNIPPIVAALSAGRTKSPHRVQMWGADDGSEGESPSGVVRIGTFHRSTLEPEQLQEAVDRAAAVASEKNLIVAADVFYRGIQYGDFAAGQSTSASAILAFYQSIEACARIVPWTQPDDYEDQRKAITLSLRTALNAKGLPKKQAEAIRDANNALNRLDATYASLRIEHAAAEFGLEREWIERSRKLGKFRNSKLGHPSLLPSSAEMSEWLQGSGPDERPLDAYGLASLMLGAALAYIR